jgi:hypothetical protein
MLTVFTVMRIGCWYIRGKMKRKILVSKDNLNKRRQCMDKSSDSGRIENIAIWWTPVAE